MSDSSNPDEALFRLFVDSVRDYAMFLLDPRGIVTSWNTGAERIKGYAAHEIIGQHFSKFYPEELVRAGKCEAELEIAAREGRFEDEGFRIRKDGSQFWANVVITALRDGTGALLGFAKVTRDLTERRRAEQERLRLVQLEEANRVKDDFLRLESEARRAADEARLSLAVMVWSIADAVLVTDEGARVTNMNPAAERLIGWRLSEARGRPAHEVLRFIDEGSRSALENPVDRVLRGDETAARPHHAILIARNGAEVPVSDTATAIREESGRTRGVIVVIRNATRERRDSLRKGFLADSTGLLAGALDYRSTLSALAELAVARIADYCAIDLFESNDEVTRIARCASRVRDDAELQRVEREAEGLVARVLESGDSEVWADASDPSRVVPEPEGTPEATARILVVPVANGPRVLGAISLGLLEAGRFYEPEDLGCAEELGRRVANVVQNARWYLAEQRAREASELANRDKDTFLATVSHELRTPLNSILGWAQILAKPGLDEARRERARATIDRNARAMDRLIEDLLDVSRIIAGKLRLELTENALGPIVEQALDSVKPAAEAKGIALRYQAESGGGKVLCDAARLSQVVANLLGNAIKFTPSGGRVSVTLSQDADSVRLSVADTGQGIEPDFLARIFDPFRQADSAGSLSSRGLGLGLAICRSLVQAHAGTITAESAGRGRGATFTVELPRASAKVARAAEVEAPPAELADEIDGLKVLVVEDDEDARELARMVLEEAGARVTTSGSVRAALTAFDRDHPDVLVSDIGLPDESGYELMKRLRSLPPELGGDIPAAAVSAYNRPEDREQALSAGFLIHAGKPIGPAELVGLVAHLARARGSSSGLGRRHSPGSTAR